MKQNRRRRHLPLAARLTGNFGGRCWYQLLKIATALELGRAAPDFSHLGWLHNQVFCCEDLISAPEAY